MGGKVSGSERPYLSRMGTVPDGPAPLYEPVIPALVYEKRNMCARRQPAGSPPWATDGRVESVSAREDATRDGNFTGTVFNAGWKLVASGDEAGRNAWQTFRQASYRVVARKVAREYAKGVVLNANVGKCEQVCKKC